VANLTKLTKCTRRYSVSEDTIPSKVDDVREEPVHMVQKGSVIVLKLKNI